MRILVDGRLISRKPTGISRYSIELLNSYIERYGSRNVTVLVNQDLDINCNKLYTKLKPYNLFHFIVFPFLVNFKQFDVFHSPFYVGPFLKQPSSLKIVLTVHDLMFLIVPNFFSKNFLLNNLAVFYYWILVRLSLNISDILISVSSTTNRDLIKLFDKESIIIPEGINLSNKGSNSQNEKLNSIIDGKYFLYVGNNRPHKNLNFLFEVFKEYSGDCKLVIAGHSNDLEINNHRIIYLPFVNDDDLVDLYKNSKAFIFPSKYEGFGLPILEAISNQTIVFSSDQGALKEFPFFSIFYFDLDSKLKLLELMQKIDDYTFNKKDLELLENYNWRKNFNSFHEVFKQSRR